MPISNHEIHVKNKIDVERALEALAYTVGEGKPVVRHALTSIVMRARYALDDIALGERS